MYIYICMYIDIYIYIYRERERESERERQREATDVGGWPHLSSSHPSSSCCPAYLAHKKQPLPLGLPQGPRYIPTIGSWRGAVSRERDTPVVSQ